MPTAIEFALGAMLLFGLADLFYKRAAMAGAQPHQFLMLQSWVFGPSVALYAFATGTLHFVPASLWGLLAGVFALTGFYNFARSLGSGSISINAPIFRLSFVLTAALAIGVLGEPLTLYKAAGIALALVAAWLLLGGPPPGNGARPDGRSSLARVLVATVAIGIANFIYTLGLRGGATPGSLIVAQAAVVMSLSTTFVAIVDGRIRPAGAAVRHAPAVAIVLALAFASMVEGMARGEASIIVPIAQMGFVVTSLLGFFFMREHFTARKGVGIAAALLALSFLALPARAASCDDAASDPQAFNECAQRYILPLEARVVQLENTLRGKYRGDSQLLERLDQANASWNAYRNAQCGMEAAARPQAEGRRIFAACTQRALEARIAELAALASRD